MKRKGFFGYWGHFILEVAMSVASVSVRNKISDKRWLIIRDEKEIGTVKEMNKLLPLQN
jgi:hypothetical protein